MPTNDTNRLNPASGSTPDATLRGIPAKDNPLRDTYSPPFRKLNETQPDTGKFTESSRPLQQPEPVPAPRK